MCIPMCVYDQIFFYCSIPKACQFLQQKCLICRGHFPYKVLQNVCNLASSLNERDQIVAGTSGSKHLPKVGTRKGQVSLTAKPTCVHHNSCLVSPCLAPFVSAVTCYILSSSQIVISLGHMQPLQFWSVRLDLHS